MPSLFVDTERLRGLNTGLGQVCLHLGPALVAQNSARRDREPWSLTFLVPKGKAGVFGDSVEYIEASWLRKLWIPGDYDVWHCLHQDSVYLPRRSKLILTIYDLNFLARANYSAARKARRLATLQRKIDRASLLTAGSGYTASIVREHLRIPATLPFVAIGTGVAIRESDAGDAPRPSFLAVGDDRPFFFFIGVVQPKKNVHTLLPLLKAFPDHRLVLAGPDLHAYAQQVREQAQALGVAGRLLMPGVVDEATKAWLYAHCRAFMFPSFSEGFGLPPAEAMTFGKPVFISNLTSLPEVGGDEAYYFENFEPESMVQVVRAGLRDFEQDPLRAERSRRRAAAFTWESVAGEYWKLYERLASQTR